MFQAREGFAVHTPRPIQCSTFCNPTNAPQHTDFRWSNRHLKFSSGPGRMSAFVVNVDDHGQSRAFGIS